MKTGKTETKHTPGPWKVIKHSGNRYCVCSSARNDLGDMIYGSRIKFNPIISDGSNKFNAHLIAAAPELLASLKLALEEGKFLPSIKDAFERTIAKAEGR